MRGLLPDFFLGSMWPGMIAFAALLISDYALTVACASLYKTHVQATVVFEGSYEMNPWYQGDIDALRIVSPRLLLTLVGYVALIALAWHLSSPELYSFMLGVALLPGLALHVRHLHNLALFRAIANGEGVRGRIEYSRRTAFRVSVVEFIAFAGLFFVIFLFTGSWFAFGGTVASLAHAWHQRDLASRAGGHGGASAPAS
jgi:hypothetical protein